MSSIHRLDVLFLLALALAAWGCAAADEERGPDAGEGVPTSEPEVGAPAGPAEEVRDGAGEEVLAAVERLVARDEPARAMERLRAALEGELSPADRARLEVSRLRLLRRALNGGWVDARIAIERERYVAGEILRGELLLENVSGGPLRIAATSPLPDAGGDATVESRSMLSRSVTYRKFVPNNTVVTQTDELNLVVDRDVELAPGQIFRIPLELDTAINDLGGTMLRSYEFGASMRCARIEVAGEAFSERIEFRPAAVYVYPLNAEHLADRPLERVREAFAKRSPVHMHLAASMVPPEDAEALLDDLERWLRSPETDDRMEAATLTCLRIAAGPRVAEGRKEDWLRWLRTRR